LGYITVRADLPGIPAENVEVTVTSRYVEIVGWPADLPGLASYHMHERPSGVLRRTLPLPEAVLAARSEASLNGGVIEIRIPRRPVTSGWTVGAKEA
jgi:HSP20 family protein